MKKVMLAVPLFAAAGSAAGQTVIDFEALRQVNNQVNNVGNQYDEDGFRFTKSPGEPFPFAFFGTTEFRFPGSTAMFNNTVNGRTILAEINGQPFNLESIKLAMLNGTGSVRVSFTGFFPGGGQIVQDFVVNDPQMPLNLQEFAFSGFEGVERVEWLQVSPFHQFDDITIGQAGCYPDCDSSTGRGVLDVFDFLCFQNRYDAGAPYACDCDTSTGPGMCDVFDFLCFQNAYDQGCP